MGLNGKLRRALILQNHAKCINSIYTEEIGAAAVCETSDSVIKSRSGSVTIDVVQRPSSNHLLLQLAQVRGTIILLKNLRG